MSARGSVYEGQPVEFDAGLDAHRGRRTTATVTLWANRVRRPGERRDDMFTLLGF